MYKKKYSGWLKHADFLILDIIVLQLSFYIAYCIRHGIGNMYADQLYAGMAIVLLLIDIVIGIIFENLHNVMKRGFWVEAIQTSKQVLEVFALFAIYLVTVQSAEQFSRTVLYLTMVFYWILNYVGRTLWKTYLKHHNRYASKRSLIIVTKADRLAALTKQLQGETYASYQILGITVVDADMMGQQIGNYTVIANADKVIEYTRTGWVDEIYIDLEPGDASAGQTISGNGYCNARAGPRCTDRIRTEDHHGKAGRYAGNNGYDELCLSQTIVHEALSGCHRRADRMYPDRYPVYIPGTGNLYPVSGTDIFLPDQGGQEWQTVPPL